MNDDFITRGGCEHVNIYCMQCYGKTSLENRVERIEIMFDNITDLIDGAQNAQDLFARKVHDLKEIDKKRDEVINALCQKIEMLYNLIFLKRS